MSLALIEKAREQRRVALGRVRQTSICVPSERAVDITNVFDVSNQGDPAGKVVIFPALQIPAKPSVKIKLRLH